MNDDIDDMFGQTGSVMTELVTIAREAKEAGASRRSFFAKTAVLAGSSALGAAGVGLLQPIAARAPPAEPTAQMQGEHSGWSGSRAMPSASAARCFAPA